MSLAQCFERRPRTPPKKKQKTQVLLAIESRSSALLAAGLDPCFFIMRGLQIAQRAGGVAVLNGTHKNTNLVESVETPLENPRTLKSPIFGNHIEL